MCIYLHYLVTQLVLFNIAVNNYNKFKHINNTLQISTEIIFLENINIHGYKRSVLQKM